jgi:hypothetical protein
MNCFDFKFEVENMIRFYSRTFSNIKCMRVQKSIPSGPLNVNRGPKSDIYVHVMEHQQQSARSAEER